MKNVQNIAFWYAGSKPVHVTAQRVRPLFGNRVYPSTKNQAQNIASKISSVQCELSFKKIEYARHFLHSTYSRGAETIPHASHHIHVTLASVRTKDRFSQFYK